MAQYPINVPAIRVDQPLGEYFVAVLPARVLLDVAFSHVMEATLNPDGLGYTVDGTQRLKQPARLNQITDYIDREDSAFPNTIILAGNFDQTTGLTADQEFDEDGADEKAHAEQMQARMWTVEKTGENCWQLRIPTPEKMAAIIDGQHRLFGFPGARPERLDMDLICSVFLDLPKPLQAQLFATINSTQKPVDKSLTYELFGYNISEESPELWSPDKLAVFLTRKLNTDPESPLAGKILVAPKRDPVLQARNDAALWAVSTAVVVEGIMRLYSSNPKRDTNEMMSRRGHTRAALGKTFKDRSPLRTIYVEGNDALLYRMILNFTRAANNVFWSRSQQGSFIVKTVGVQALFDVLRRLSTEAYNKRDVSESFFTERLQAAGSINFADDRFRSPSGSGRTMIRRAIEDAIGLTS